MRALTEEETGDPTPHMCAFPLTQSNCAALAVLAIRAHVIEFMCVCMLRAEAV